MESLVDVEPSAVDIAIMVMSFVGLLCFAVKAACLIWAFVRTRKVAALFYIAFLIVSPIVPIVTAKIIGATNFALFSIYYNVAAGVLEAGLFIWLVRSLLKRRSLPTGSSISTDSASGASQDWL